MVVAGGWGTELIKFYAALTIKHQDTGRMDALEKCIVGHTSASSASSANS